MKCRTTRVRKLSLLRGGFTIVELLIVIVVIGILAAISIVAYNGIQERARLATLNSDVSNAAKQIGMYYAGTGSYPATINSLRASDFHDYGSVWTRDDSVHRIVIYCTDGERFTVASRQSGVTPIRWVGAGSEYGVKVLSPADPGAGNHQVMCNGLGYPGTHEVGGNFFRWSKTIAGWQFY